MENQPVSTPLSGSQPNTSILSSPIGETRSERTIQGEERHTGPIEEVSRSNPPFTEYETATGKPYAFEFFGISDITLEGDDRAVLIKDMATKVEQWARREVYRRGMENGTEVFDYLMKEMSHDLGLPEYTHKLTLLEQASKFIEKNKPKTEIRDKIKKVKEALLEEQAEHEKRIRAANKGKVSKLERELAEANSIIKQQKKSLKSIPTKGR